MFLYRKKKKLICFFVYDTSKEYFKGSLNIFYKKII